MMTWLGLINCFKIYCHNYLLACSLWVARADEDTIIYHMFYSAVFLLRIIQWLSRILVRANICLLFSSQPNGEMSNNNNNSVDVIKVDQLDRELSQSKEVNKKIAEKLTLVEQENHVLKSRHQDAVPKADYCRYDLQY